jgi:hypothetical protein
VLLAPAGRPVGEVTLEQIDFLTGRARAAGQPTEPYEALRGQLRELAARRLPADAAVLGARPGTGTISTTGARSSARGGRGCRRSPCSGAATTR